MRIDHRRQTERSVSALAPLGQQLGRDPLGRYDGEGWFVAETSVQSSVVSPDAARALWKLVELTDSVLTQVASEPFTSEFTRWQFPVLIADQRDAQASPAHDPETVERFRRLEAALVDTFKSDPPEDGVVHQAEEIIEAALRSVPAEGVLEHLRRLVLDPGRPTLGAAVLRILGRLNAGSIAWRKRIVRNALGSENVEIRDAAVQAAESWADPEVLEVLRGHDEQVAWLRRYVRDVLREPGE